MTAAEIHALLLEILVAGAGGSEEEWRRAIGKIRVRPVAFYVMSNWHVAPIGSEDQKQAVRTAAQVIRRHHPYAGD